MREFKVALAIGPGRSRVGALRPRRELPARRPPRRRQARSARRARDRAELRARAGPPAQGHRRRPGAGGERDSAGCHEDAAAGSRRTGGLPRLVSGLAPRRAVHRGDRALPAGEAGAGRAESRRLRRPSTRASPACSGPSPASATTGRSCRGSRAATPTTSAGRSTIRRPSRTCRAASRRSPRFRSTSPPSSRSTIRRSSPIPGSISSSRARGFPRTTRSRFCASSCCAAGR